MRERPLSPHLSVYRFKYTLVTSISNRATGIVLSAGFLLFAYWLVSVASGPEAYARASALLSHAIMKPVYAVLLISFAYHMAAGIRHLIWDTGRGMEREQAKRSAWWLGVATLLLVVGLGYFAFVARGGLQ